MNFSVRWTRSARDELASIWMASAHRKAVTQAAHRIESLLGHDPRDAGESRGGDQRIVIDYPLAVTYRILEVKQEARIFRVRACRPRS